MTKLPRDYIAHPEQSLKDHLLGVGNKARNFASKLGLAEHGEVLGLLHDLGKYSTEFQNYIRSALGMIDPDEDEENQVNADALKGKVDHSTAGAQFIWDALSPKGRPENIVAQVLGLCIASHHSGLIDCIGADQSRYASDVFSQRMKKVRQAGEKYVEDVIKSVDPEIIARCVSLINATDFVSNLFSFFQTILEDSERRREGRVVAIQKIGLSVRFLFSCLIDADRIDTADAECQRLKRVRAGLPKANWNLLIHRLEAKLQVIQNESKIGRLRAQVSQHCLEAASFGKGCFTFTGPTGVGKNLASLRYGLHHAAERKLERIIYIIPFTSIIEQNAQVARDTLETVEERGQVVLEHHSNLLPEQQSWREKILSENWDAPIIYTTMVQFLETILGGGTRGARRFHQLANAVMIFDEVQSIPVKCVHLFNNAINFLVEHCNSTALLCTATQPILHALNVQKGSILLHPKSEIIPDVRKLFEDLRRVEIRDYRRVGGWSHTEIGDLALREKSAANSCLVITNTKKSARAVYEHCKQHVPAKEIYHLSTDMCAAHRRRILAAVKERLDKKLPVICVSTQLIEAGVDIDFGRVVRFLAGLDSIAQAAGRCNRNGIVAKGIVYIVNAKNEHVDMLRDIAIGRDKAERVLDEYAANPEQFDCDLIGPKALESYYRYYFFAQESEMDYPVSKDDLGHDDTLGNLLSLNEQATNDYCRQHKTPPPIFLRQAFMSAARSFKAIEAPTRGVIVPYGDEGRALIAGLCSSFDVENDFKLIRQSQQYTVNVFPNILSKLIKEKAVMEIKAGTHLLFLDERYYSGEFGLSVEAVANMSIEVL